MWWVSLNVVRYLGLIIDVDWYVLYFVSEGKVNSVNVLLLLFLLGRKYL